MNEEPILYSGLIFDKATQKELREFAGKQSLGVEFANLHIRDQFCPAISAIHEEFLGKTATVMVIAYGRDHKHEVAFLDAYDSDDISLQKHLENLNVKAMTLSASIGERAVEDTYFDKVRCQKYALPPFQIKGKYGIYCKDGTVHYSLDELENIKVKKPNHNNIHRFYAHESERAYFATGPLNKIIFVKEENTIE